MTTPALVLASASLRRRQLVHYLFDDVQAIATDLDESFDSEWEPSRIARDLAIRKALAGFAECSGSVVIGADTIVVCDGLVLNKPENRAHAREMLTLLSGRSHEVWTGIAVIGPNAGDASSDAIRTLVRFRDLSDLEVEQYLDSGVWTDKAGGYGIQGAGGDIVESVEGCFQSVVGFPLCAIGRMLQEHGIAVKTQPQSCGLRSDALCLRWPGSGPS